MNYIKSLTQQKLSLLLSLYIGILLNLPIFYRRFDPFLNKSTLTDWLSAGAEVMAIVLLTFFLMRLLSLGGKLFYRILATVLVLISVAAAYYMAFFNVVIGYGIVASVMTTDIDLSKEVVGYQFVLWMVLVSALPLL
ncbi:MAG TPA: lipid A phosphoethanolamine transferase, partial [Erwiniaceae bacterium]|nr:lipid A phosphoethanolamine transferase [Erwiniaceae bacterium]